MKNHHTMQTRQDTNCKAIHLNTKLQNYIDINPCTKITVRHLQCGYIHLHRCTIQ